MAIKLKKNYKPFTASADLESWHTAKDIEELKKKVSEDIEATYEHLTSKLKDGIIINTIHIQPYDCEYRDGCELVIRGQQPKTKTEINREKKKAAQKAAEIKAREMKELARLKKKYG